MIFIKPLMHHKSHRFTNMEEYKNNMKSQLRFDENEFEVIYTEQKEEDRFEESHLPYLRKEDNEIGTLQMYLSHNIRNFIPRKDKQECTSIFSNSNLMKTVKDKPTFVCLKHLEKKANQICLNKSCEHVIFCMKCRGDHEANCSRKTMSMTINDCQQLDFVNDYFDVDEYDFDEKIENVKELVEEKRKKMIEMLDVLEMILINKLKLQAKEFKLRQMKESINDKHTEFKGK